MKMKSIQRFPGMAILIGLLIFSSYPGQAQGSKKERVRISVNYINIIDGDDLLNIKTTARINKETVFVSGIELEVLTEEEESERILGTTNTNMNGEARFVIKDTDNLKPDSTHTFNLQLRFKGNDTFRKASKSITFKKATISTELVSKDSLNYVSATLSDVGTDSVITGESMSVYVNRLFRPLRIGEEFNITDDNGTIFVNIDSDIPGIDGILDIQVVLEEHDEYGTVKAQFQAPVGVPVVEETTFFKRTMWSSRDKTPLFLLIFPNLLILAMWGIIVYLFINLFKIAKK